MFSFGDLSDLFRRIETFFGLLEPGLFRDFLGDFWLLAPRRPLPDPRNLKRIRQNHGLGSASFCLKVDCLKLCSYQQKNFAGVN